MIDHANERKFWKANNCSYGCKFLQIGAKNGFPVYCKLMKRKLSYYDGPICECCSEKEKEQEITQ
jgi:hypothetical protein